MILIGLGGNLPSRDFGEPRRTLAAALDALNQRRVFTRVRSRWYRSAPVPDDGAPWYTNAVARVDTDHAPAQLLEQLLGVEAAFGRIRGRRNAPRPIDLDLLAYHDLVTWNTKEAAPSPTLPHPRMHQRAFVLLPLAEIAPGWRHPVLGATAEELVGALPPGVVSAVRPQAEG